MIKEVDYPHCWGKMTWVMDEKEGNERSDSICNCEYGSKVCLSKTRDKANVIQPKIDELMNKPEFSVFSEEFTELFN